MVLLVIETSANTCSTQVTFSFKPFKTFKRFKVLRNDWLQNFWSPIAGYACFEPSVELCSG